MAKTSKKTVLTKEEVENLTSLQKQQNDLKVRKLIEERTKIDGPSSTS